MENRSPIEVGQDPLVAYRARIMYSLATAAVLLLVPFSINAFVQGNPALAVGILGGVFILGVDAIAVYLKRSPPIPLILLLVPLVPAMAISLKVQGFFGVLWCYPTVLLFTFSLSRRIANVCNVLMLVLISALVSPRRNRSIIACFSGAGIRPCNSSQRNGRSRSCHCSNSAAAAFTSSFSLSSMSG